MIATILARLRCCSEDDYDSPICEYSNSDDENDDDYEADPDNDSNCSDGYSTDDSEGVFMEWNQDDNSSTCV